VNPFLDAKAGLLVIVLVAAFCVGWRLGGNGPRAALERDHAAMAEAATQAILAQQKQATADHVRLQGVIDNYDAIKDSPDLAYAAAGTAHRLYIRAAGGSCAVSQAGGVASGTETPAPVPSSHSSVESALGDVLTACSQDAAQLSAVIQLAP